MAGACRRLAISWLMILASVGVGGTSNSGDIIWPAGASDFEVWNVLDELEPAIIGNALRISDLAIKMADMGEKTLADPVQRVSKRHYTECKCRLDCLAANWCVAFKFKNNNHCLLYSSRGATFKDAVAGHVTCFKMLNAAVGDVCKIDLECSRQTLGAICQLANASSASNSSTCQCPGDWVPHSGACVDPMTLTTTEPTTTTIATTTPAPTTAAAATAATTAAADVTTVIITTTVPPPPVTEGSVTLDDMLKEVDWPCDEANSDPDACQFMEDFAPTASEMWKETVDGECDLARGRCKYPAILSTSISSEATSAARIEAWRSAGHFLFDMEQDFPSPPAAIGDTYSPGPSEPGDAWKYDCSTTDGTSTVLTGFLGVANDHTYQKNIPRDMDLILCTRFTTIFLKVDPAVAVKLDISNNGEFKCPPNHVITGVWDSDKEFAAPKAAKCSKLVSGNVNVDDPSCVMTRRHTASNVAIYWNACAQDAGPSVVAGLSLHGVTSDTETKEWDLRCCPVTGPATSTSVD